MAGQGVSSATATGSATPDRVGFGIACMVGAVLIFTIMDFFIRILALRGYPTWQVMFCRNFFAMIPVMTMVFRHPDGLAVLKTSRPGGHLLRGAVGLLSMYLFFYSYGFLTVADVAALGFSAPLFMTALSVLLMREKVGLHRWTAVLVGFAGVLIIVKPGQGVFDVHALYPLGGAFCYALAMIQIRRLSGSESSLSIVFYFTCLCLAVTAAVLPFVWVTPKTWEDAGFMTLVGLLGGCGQVLMTRAFMSGPVSTIAPFDYTSLLWAVLIGWLFLAEIPDLQVLAGGVVVAASGLYILRREALKQRAGARS